MHEMGNILENLQVICSADPDDFTMENARIRITVRFSVAVKNDLHYYPTYASHSGLLLPAQQLRQTTSKLLTDSRFGGRRINRDRDAKSRHNASP